MPNNYLNYISDEHLLSCIGNLYAAYEKAKANISKKKLYSNKIDIIKLTFDAKFNEMEEEKLIETEIIRQIDKTINNSIGTFHEEVLGGIKGFEKGNLSGYDIKATDDSLFAEIKNKHNTMNSSSSESSFQRLADYANRNRQAKCYLVQILATKSFHEPWVGIINGKEYSHSRVFKISGDRFYALLTGQEEAFFQLYRVLPIAISDFLKSIEKENANTRNSALGEIQKESQLENRGILHQIAFENFPYYKGFDSL